MERTYSRWYPFCIKVVRFEGCILPCSTTHSETGSKEKLPLQHLNVDISFLFLDIQTETLALLNGEIICLFFLNEFPFWQIWKRWRMGASFEYMEQFLACRVLNRVNLRYKKFRLQSKSTCLTNFLLSPLPIHLFLKALPWPNLALSSPTALWELDSP